MIAMGLHGRIMRVRTYYWCTLHLSAIQKVSVCKTILDMSFTTCTGRHQNAHYPFNGTAPWTLLC